jgi:hypothetical protein
LDIRLRFVLLLLAAAFTVTLSFLPCSLLIDSHGELKSPLSGMVLSGDFRKSTGWEIELKIPRRRLSQILQAFDGLEDSTELNVDLLLLSAPTETFRGKLSRTSIADEANPQREDNNESEPVLLGYVRIDGPDIPVSLNLVRRRGELLVAGTAVHARIRCGHRPMGAALFRGMWECFYQ